VIGDWFMSAAKSFRDLRVHQLARAAAGEIFEASKSFPHEERYSLTDQIRRSSRATKASETQSWLDDAYDCGYIKSAKFEKMETDRRSVTAMLAKMSGRASDFCKYASDTSHRGMTMEEEPLIWSDEIKDESDAAI
jgi:23S rRNA-intervening sequence protein